MSKQQVLRVIHTTPCRRDVLIPAMEKLDEQELSALWHLVQNVSEESQRNGERQVFRNIGRYPGRF